MAFVQGFTFLIEHIYVQFEDSSISRLLGFPLVKNCPSLKADLFYHYYEKESLPYFNIFWIVLKHGQNWSLPMRMHSPI